MNLGICRPHPVYFYLQNDWKDSHFQREPVSLAFVAIFVLSILTLHGLIELKKRKANQDVFHAEEIAEAAKQNIEKAKMKLQLQKDFDLRDLESSTLQFEMDSKSSSTIPEEEESMQLKQVENVSSQNALKVARGVSIFSIFPAAIFSVFFSLENVGDWRPHGASASSMILFGIVAPSVFYLRNEKMRQFAKKYLTAELGRWKIKRNNRRIAPIL